MISTVVLHNQVIKNQMRLCDHNKKVYSKLRKSLASKFLDGVHLGRATQVNVPDANDFMEPLNEKMGIMFTTPEVSIIDQDESAEDMFFILKGDCIVDMVDYDNQVHETIRILVMSDYFGEIALLHQCKRTCTVISRNYNTMGRITYDRFRMLLHEYPSLR